MRPKNGRQQKKVPRASDVRQRKRQDEDRELREIEERLESLDSSETTAFEDLPLSKATLKGACEILEYRYHFEL